MAERGKKCEGGRGKRKCKQKEGEMKNAVGVSEPRGEG